jgi:hypothetical protein
MPTAPDIEARTEATVGSPALKTYDKAKAIVRESKTLKDAVEKGHFLDGLENADEALAVLDALPANVDAAFMASLNAALDGNQNIAFRWREGAFAHEATESGGTVTLWLQCPNGATFLDQA